MPVWAWVLVGWVAIDLLLVLAWMRLKRATNDYDEYDR
jgi:hypothetical protein